MKSFTQLPQKTTITMKVTVDQIDAKTVLAPVIKERTYHLLIKSLIPITNEVSVTSRYEIGTVVLRENVKSEWMDSKSDR